MAQTAKTDDRERALDTTISNLKKRYGDGAIMKFGEAADMRVEAMPTGALWPDLALGVGAFYTFGDTRLGQGRENAKAFLQENSAVFDVLDSRIREASGLPGRSGVTA